jgi:inhibitor of KinA
MPETASYRIFPLGDAALTIDFGNRICEELNDRAIDLFRRLQPGAFPGFVEAVPAYASLTIYYDPVTVREAFPGQSAFATVRKRAEALLLERHQPNVTEPPVIRVPVCYHLSFGIDLDALARERDMEPDTLIQLHCAPVYRVYMLGFLPGFAYMGPVDERIIAARKHQPRTRVEPGSVAIAGRQTGIYPVASPGGWQIIGRTWLTLFDPNKEPITYFRAGDRVQFYPISIDEYNDHQGRDS